jgi:hypothetical protein
MQDKQNGSKVRQAEETGRQEMGGGRIPKEKKPQEKDRTLEIFGDKRTIGEDRTR